MENKTLIEKLKRKSQQLRILAIKSVHSAGSGHLGGSFSSAEIIACLYFSVMNVNSKSPKNTDRDRFILSKGHSCPILYSALALKGFFPKNELIKLRKINSLLQGHPDVRIPGIDFPSGSLGNGLAAAIGMAQEAHERKIEFHVYVLLGDGDMQEGSNDEALRLLGYLRYSNVTAILDSNKRQGEDLVVNTLNYLTNLDTRIRSYGWNVIEINGHKISEVLDALNKAKQKKNCPTFIIANTIKGKGVSFMEDVQKWHGSLAPSDSELKQALKELNYG